MKTIFKLSLVMLFASCLQLGYSQQEGSSPKCGFYGAGLSMGWYNPSLDYWKGDSLFMNAGYNGAIDAKAFTDIRLVKNLSVQVGIGYWQQTLQENIKGFGDTKLIITGYPISVNLNYQLLPLQFSIITPYLGLGGEFLIIQNKLRFEDVDDPDAETGSTFLGHGIVGLDAKLSQQFILGLEFQYRLGKYTQDFKSEEFDPANPDNPIVTIYPEDISLNGPRLGILLRYLF